MTRVHRASAALALGSVVSGLLAYVLFALVTRGLGATAAAPVSVLWTHWALAGAGLTFPLQHWITRSVVAGREGDVRRAARPVGLLVLAAALVLGVLAWLVRERLFHRDDAWFPVLVVLVTLGSAAVGVARGGLGGRGRFGAVAWSLVAENGLRCVLVGALLLAGVHDPVAHGLCLVAGSLVACWPAAWRFSDSPAGMSRPLAFLGGAASAQLVSQAVLTGGPVLLALLGGSPQEVTAMFAALALFRAPYMVVLASAPQVTLRVTEHVVAGDRPALRRLAGVVVGLTVAGVSLAAPVGAFLGPPVLRLVFGDTIDVSAWHAAVVAVGCTLAVSNLWLMLGAFAGGAASEVAGAWAIAVVVGAGGVLGLGALSPTGVSAGAFLVAEVTATSALSAVAWRSFRHVGSARLDRSQEH